MYTNSLFVLFTAGLAAVATAYTQPKGDTPSGNPIAKPGLGEIVPVGTPYTITWTPTTSTTGSVTLLLLRGPSENVKPLYPIVESVPNTGSYSWTPAASLEPDTTRYGIQLIVDADGSYQYTTQFGISNPGYAAVSSSVSVAASSASSVLSSAMSSAASVVSSASVAISSASSVVKAASLNGTITRAFVASTGYPAGNSSVITPTNSMTIPSSLRLTTTLATGSAVASPSSAPSTPATGAAATGLRVGGALGLVMGLAAVAL